MERLEDLARHEYENNEEYENSSQNSNGSDNEYVEENELLPNKDCINYFNGSLQELFTLQNTSSMYVQRKTPENRQNTLNEIYEGVHLSLQKDTKKYFQQVLEYLNENSEAEIEVNNDNIETLGFNLPCLNNIPYYQLNLKIQNKIIFDEKHKNIYNKKVTTEEENIDDKVFRQDIYNRVAKDLWNFSSVNRPQDHEYQFRKSTKKYDHKKQYKIKEQFEKDINKIFAIVSIKINKYFKLSHFYDNQKEHYNNVKSFFGTIKKYEEQKTKTLQKNYFEKYFVRKHPFRTDKNKMMGELFKLEFNRLKIEEVEDLALKLTNEFLFDIFNNFSALDRNAMINHLLGDDVKSEVEKQQDKIGKEKEPRKVIERYCKIVTDKFYSKLEIDFQETESDRIFEKHFQQEKSKKKIGNNKKDIKDRKKMMRRMAKIVQNADELEDIHSKPDKKLRDILNLNIELPKRVFRYFHDTLKYCILLLYVRKYILVDHIKYDDSAKPSLEENLILKYNAIIINDIFFRDITAISAIIKQICNDKTINLELPHQETPTSRYTKDQYHNIQANHDKNAKEITQLGTQLQDIFITYMKCNDKMICEYMNLEYSEKEAEKERTKRFEHAHNKRYIETLEKQPLGGNEDDIVSIKEEVWKLVQDKKSSKPQICVMSKEQVNEFGQKTNDMYSEQLLKEFIERKYIMSNKQFEYFISKKDKMFPDEPRLYEKNIILISEEDLQEIREEEFIWDKEQEINEMFQKQYKKQLEHFLKEKDINFSKYKSDFNKQMKNISNLDKLENEFKDKLSKYFKNQHNRKLDKTYNFAKEVHMEACKEIFQLHSKNTSVSKLSIFGPIFALKEKSLRNKIEEKEGCEDQHQDYYHNKFTENFKNLFKDPVFRNMLFYNGFYLYKSLNRKPDGTLSLWDNNDYIWKSIISTYMITDDYSGTTGLKLSIPSPAQVENFIPEHVSGNFVNTYVNEVLGGIEKIIEIDTNKDKKSQEDKYGSYEIYRNIVEEILETKMAQHVHEFWCEQKNVPSFQKDVVADFMKHSEYSEHNQATDAAYVLQLLRHILYGIEMYHMLHPMIVHDTPSTLYIENLFCTNESYLLGFNKIVLILKENIENAMEEYYGKQDLENIEDPELKEEIEKQNQTLKNFCKYLTDFKQKL